MKRITLTIVSLVTLVTASSAALAQDPVPPTPPATPAPRVLRAPVAEPMVHVTTPRPGEMLLEAPRALEMRRMALADMAYTPRPSVATTAPMAPMAWSYGDGMDRRLPPAPWAQGDPADSLYRRARTLLDQGEYGTSARIFADIQKNYQSSAYRGSAQYWEAFARYKIGTTDELQQAAKLLEPMASKITPGTNSSFTVDRRTSDNDILALYTRINGALAMRGNADAAARVAQAAKQQGTPCDNEDQTLRVEALSALNQIDPAQAMALLKRVVEKKDECSVQLRRNAIFMLGRRADTESAALLLSVAKSDPSVSVRTEAVRALGRTPGEAGINALEDMLRNEQDERIQRAAVQALMSSDNQRARTGMRALIDRKDAPMNLRVEAINSFSTDRATAEDAAYLRGLFAKAENDQMKIAILNTVGRIGGPENDQWVMGIARSTSESSSVRANAINRIMRSNTISVADLSKMYDAAAESYEIRSRIINALGNRKEPEASDKLYEIARSSTVINHRIQAVNALNNKKDPRATKLLEDILDGKKP